MSTIVPTPRPPAAPVRTWLRIARVAGVFALVIACVMLIGHIGTSAEDPLKSPRLKELKEKLRQNPADEPLKQQIRQLDLDLRGQYFRQLSRTGSGVYLLIGGAAVFAFAMLRAAAAEKRPPMPQGSPGTPELAAQATARSRWAVAGTGAAAIAFLLLLGYTVTSPLPSAEAAVDKALGLAPKEPFPTMAAALPSLKEYKLNWPRFRGPDANGVSVWTNAPESWDVKTGKGVLWKVASPLSGFNSPVVWGERVFISGGDAKKREVVCFDGKTGAIAWRQEVSNVPGSPATPPEVPDSTGYAAGTMATDGQRLYTFFANGDAAAFTLEGKLVWSKSFGAPKNPYGHATSLATWKDRLILQLDQGDSEDGKSKLYAVDGLSGNIVWQTPRKVGASWASPIVFDAAGKTQIVVLSVPWAAAYSATDGAELWKVDCLSGEITPSPVLAGGLVIVPSPSDKLLGIRPDGAGDVTKTHIAWTNEDNVPDVTSPAANNEFVFTMGTSGILTCIDVKDGKKLWEHDYEIEFHSSPTLVGNKVFLLSQKGSAVVVEAARQYKELFRTEMGDKFHASPAFANNKIYLRGVTNVWCLGK